MKRINVLQKSAQKGSPLFKKIFDIVFISHLAPTTNEDHCRLSLLITVFGIWTERGLLWEKSLRRKKDFEERKVASMLGVPAPPRLDGKNFWRPRV